MIGLLIKLIICPSVVLLATVLLPSIFYSSTYAPIIVGLVLAVIAHVMELFLLKRETLWISTALDFLAATLIVYLSQFIFVGSTITWTGAFYAGLFLAITEAAQHWYLINTGKTQKS